ncbi:uncharacterized protein LOC133717580 [Rosa rugosa]|uniref:uncharacterized protein LOC133717580 n=1 Tax=Rosa rugosa TaxID=74645 RepID=UPI002B40C335|nr:uncharacterized protein LOC133717580 [Rosa rugosa]
MNFKCLIKTFVLCVRAYQLEHGFPKGASVRKDFDSERHFTAGIQLTRLLEVLVCSLCGLFCKWCKAICFVAVERNAGGRRLLVVTVVGLQNSCCGSKWALEPCMLTLCLLLQSTC